MPIREKEKHLSSAVHGGALMRARKNPIDPSLWQGRNRSKPSGRGMAEEPGSAADELSQHHSGKGFQTSRFDPPDGLI